MAAKRKPTAYYTPRGPYKAEHAARLTVTLAPCLRDALRATATSQGRPVSTLVSEAISAYLSATEKAPPTLCDSCGEEYHDESVYAADYGRCCAEPSEGQP